MDQEIGKRIQVRLLVKQQEELDHWSNLSFEHQEKYPKFDILNWNNNLPMLKEEIIEQIRDEIIFNQELFNSLNSEINNNLNRSVEIMNIYNHLFKLNWDHNMLNLFKSMIKNHISIYEINYMINLNIPISKIESYTDIQKLYKSIKPIGNLELFKEIINIIDNLKDRIFIESKGFHLIFAILNNYNIYDINFFQKLMITGFPSYKIKI